VANTVELTPEWQHGAVVGLGVLCVGAAVELFAFIPPSNLSFVLPLFYAIVGLITFCFFAKLCLLGKDYFVRKKRKRAIDDGLAAIHSHGLAQPEAVAVEAAPNERPKARVYSRTPPGWT